MSRQGERVARRLVKRHGLRFLYDPCNYRIRCDREAVQRNVRGGQRITQWILGIEGSTELPRIMFGGELTAVEIGSDHSASELLRATNWLVAYCPELRTSGVIICIYSNSGEDRTELKPDRK